MLFGTSGCWDDGLASSVAQGRSPAQTKAATSGEIQPLSVLKPTIIPLHATPFHHYFLPPN